MQYKRYSSNWPATMYIEEIESQTGLVLSEETRLFLYDFFDISKESEGKRIFYETLYNIKRRCYPKSLLLFFAKRKYKNAFKLNNAPSELGGLETIFARLTLDGAIKKYCNTDEK